jgi:hypothetical protein
MRSIQASFGILLVGSALVAAGCGSKSAPPAESMPATMPAATMPAMVMPTPTVAMVKPPADKDLTHVLTKDEPYFSDMPSAGATPAGTLKEGSKVLVLIPGTDYSQVTTDKGVSAYTATDGLKPLGK